METLYHLLIFQIYYYLQLSNAIMCSDTTSTMPINQLLHTFFLGYVWFPKKY